jgi:Protein of unknown function (DUF998)
MTGTGAQPKDLPAASDAAQARRRSGQRRRRARTTRAHRFLDGASLTPMAWVLVACGTVGGLLFTVTYLVEGATRASYDPWGQAISALSLGPGGWVQRVNFAVFGVAVIASAAGWRRALRPGRGARAYPLLRGIAGLGLIMDSVFSQDPAPGYPAGTLASHPTVHGQVHTLFAFVAIMALAASCFVLARRFAAEPQWRRWTGPAVTAGVLTIVFIAAFGAMGAHGGMTGLFERLAGGVESVLGIAVVTRLAIQALAGRSRVPDPSPSCDPARCQVSSAAGTTGPTP